MPLPAEDNKWKADKLKRSAFCILLALLSPPACQPHCVATLQWFGAKNAGEKGYEDTLLLTRHTDVPLAPGNH